MNLSVKNEAKHLNVNTTETSVIPEISVAFEAHELHSYLNANLSKTGKSKYPFS